MSEETRASAGRDIQRELLDSVIDQTLNSVPADGRPNELIALLASDYRSAGGPDMLTFDLAHCWVRRCLDRVPARLRGTESAWNAMTQSIATQFFGDDTARAKLDQLFQTVQRTTR